MPPKSIHKGTHNTTERRPHRVGDILQRVDGQTETVKIVEWSEAQGCVAYHIKWASNLEGDTPNRAWVDSDYLDKNYIEIH